MEVHAAALQHQAKKLQAFCVVSLIIQLEKTYQILVRQDSRLECLVLTARTAC